MAATQLNKMVQHIRQAVLSSHFAELSDAQLLERFSQSRDDAAFAALVRRHGPMVLGVCRRILQDHHDAEDAFQATFLVLVRKASTIFPRKMLAGWLYGVATNTAIKARALAIRRSAKEKQMTDLPEPEIPSEHESDIIPVVDEELAHLPEKYRLPIILCDLEGKTHSDAAVQLGVPIGTLSGRLSRGRRFLAQRLQQRGLLCSAGTVAALLGSNSATAFVPPALATNTLKAATLLATGKALAGTVSTSVITLTEGVVTAMFINKLKAMTMALVVAVALGVSSSAIVQQNLDAADDTIEQARRSVPGSPEATGGQKMKESDDHQRIQGSWQLIYVKFDGQMVPLQKETKVNLWRFEDGRFYGLEGKESEATYRLNPHARPKRIEFFDDGDTNSPRQRGIYAFQNDYLLVCVDRSSFPDDFSAAKGSSHNLFVLKRAQHTKRDVLQEQINDIINSIEAGQSKSPVNDPNQSTAPASRKTMNGWQLSAQPEKSTVVAGEPVKVIVTLKNVSDQPLVYGEHQKGGGDYYMALELSGPYGDLTRFGRQVYDKAGKLDELPVIGRTVLPGQEVKSVINVSRAFDMTMPGNYKITVRHSFAYRPGEKVGGRRANVIANPVTVRIVEPERQ